MVAMYVLCSYNKDIMVPEQQLRQRPLAYSTLYVDMNSFFASVEQYYQPRLRGLPVAVCAGTADTCTVLAASIQAKKFGVRTGTKVADAKRMCPDIVCTNGDHQRYRAVHKEFMEILHNTTCYVEARGIDEAFMKLPRWSCSQEFALSLAKEIKSNMLSKYSEHILCSIGIGANIWLAKMAAGCRKPNGLTIIGRDLPDWLSKWRLTDMVGINRRMARQFVQRDIYTPTDLYNASMLYLRSIWGVNGVKWYLRLRGVEVDRSAPSENKMLGHQITTLPNAPKNIEEITTYCVRIATTLGKRLRNKGLFARYMGLHILYVDFESEYFDLRTTRNFHADSEIITYSKTLLKKLRNIRPVRRISMYLSDLTSHYQPYLPLDVIASKPLTASDISDTINNRFASEVMLPASSFFAKSIRLDRVGFGGDQVKESYKYNLGYLDGGS